MRPLWSAIAVGLVAVTAQAQAPEWALPSSGLLPSGRQAVALVSNLMSGVDLEIIDLSRGPPTSTKVTTMPNCGDAGPDSFLRPIPVRTDERHVTFEGESPLPEDKPDTKHFLRVEGGKGQRQC
ncbi:MAG: hypothetical protein GEV13_25170 [Rhodospirillales bacterium]|nr:hypothetical protein [Rhodospirillales bacterium]